MTKPAKKETAKDVRRRLQTRLQMFSAEIAIVALEEVCADKKAPAPARAAAGTSILRAAGLFDTKDRNFEEKQPHEMTAEELHEAAERAEERLAATAEADEDVFE